MGSEVIDQQVVGVSFGFYTSEALLALSVCPVTNAHSFDALHQPVPGGLYDARLGPLDPHDRCATCGQTQAQCVGHLGHIALTLPVYQPLLFDLLVKLLRAQCWHCHRFKLSRAAVHRVTAQLRLIEAGLLAQAQQLDEDAHGEGKADDAAGVRKAVQQRRMRRGDDVGRTNGAAATNGAKRRRPTTAAALIDDEAADDEEGDDDESDGIDAPSSPLFSSSRPSSARASAVQSRLQRLSAAAGQAYARHVRLFGHPPPLTSAALEYRHALLSAFLRDLQHARRCANCGAFSPRLRKDGHSKIFRTPLPRKEQHSNDVHHHHLDHAALQAADRLPGALSAQRPAVDRPPLNGNGPRGRPGATARGGVGRPAKRPVASDDSSAGSGESSAEEVGGVPPSGDSSDSEAELRAAGVGDVDRALLADDDSALRVEAEVAEDNRRAPVLMFPTEVEALLERLWKEEAAVLEHLWGGAAHAAFTQQRSADAAPQHALFFIRVLAVPPSRFRPPSLLNGVESDHPHNAHLKRIIEADARIRRMAVARPQRPKEPTAASSATTISAVAALDWGALVESWLALQEAVNALIDSSTSASANAPQDGLRQVLEKKEGLFRRNMMGKRVNFAARSVISPDPFLNTNEIGVPELFATQLTFPEPVTAFNVDSLRAAVLNGPDVHPGANAIEDERGVLVSLAHKSPAQRSALAKTLLSTATALRGAGAGAASPLLVKRVLRHIRNGDVMLVNRQPTLHKPSMMSHRVRVLRGRSRMWQTIRMHYVNCNSYNADFDGDEMNLHVPQCFPERDTRVLTDAGFLFLDDIEARLARGEQVLYACFQSSRKPPVHRRDAMKGELVYRPGALVFPPAPAELVVFHSDAREAPPSQTDGGSCEAPRRSTTCTAEETDGATNGEVVDGAALSSRHVSLRVTPQHEMYVQLGRPGARMAAPPQKVRASALLSSDASVRMRLLACAEGGRFPSAAERSAVEAVLARLQLTDAQLPAFLELFGLWVSGGSLCHAPRAVYLARLEPDDAAFVDRALAAAGLRDGQFYRSTNSLPRRGREGGALLTSWRIVEPRWCEWFDEEFGAMYPASRHYDPAVAGIKRGNPPPRSQSGPADAASGFSCAGDRQGDVGHSRVRGDGGECASGLDGLGESGDGRRQRQEEQQQQGRLSHPHGPDEDAVKCA